MTQQYNQPLARIEVASYSQPNTPESSDSEHLYRYRTPQRSSVRTRDRSMSPRGEDRRSYTVSGDGPERPQSSSSQLARRYSGTTTGHLTLGPNEHENCKLPKNFSKPLTCFYWYYNGRCNKSDEACYYAHYHTGMVASAPVGTGRGRAIAGRQAEYHMDAIHAREEAAVSREKALRAEGEVLRREEARITQLKNRLLEGLETMDQASTDVRRVLQRRRADLAALNVEGNFHENIDKVLKAVDGMNGAVAGFHQQVTSAMKNLNGLDIDSFIPATSTGRVTSAPTYPVTSTVPGTNGSTTTVSANSRAHVQIPGLTTIAPASGPQRPHPLPARIFTEGSSSEFTEHSIQIHTPISESHPDLVIAKQE